VLGPGDNEQSYSDGTHSATAASEDESSRRDWLSDALDRALESGQQAALALARSVDNVRELRRDPGYVQSVETMIELMVKTKSRATRRAAEDAFHQYQRALMELRALMIRSLVEDSGSTYSDIGRAMGLSRQKVTELYRVGQSLNPPSDRQSGEDAP
jgi:hypothetical protein